MRRPASRPALSTYRSAFVLAAAAASAIVGPALASSNARGSGSVAKAASLQRSFTTAGSLRAVTATSATDAWAVGSSAYGAAGAGAPLIIHWNGISWTRVPSPSAGAGASLYGVTATSASNAWAVGSSGTRGLILNWNGTVWTQQAMPTLQNSYLYAVAASSPADAWAVGSSRLRTLILHWDGNAWRKVPSPAGTLSSVAAVTARNAWAVGATSRFRTMILHWNGTVWRRVTSPSPTAGTGLADILSGVAVMSKNYAWAVGSSGCGCGPGTSLTERWNGRAWRREPSPRGRFGIGLSSVAGFSAHGAWAVGDTGEGDGPTKTVILRWNGAGWKRVSAPSPGRYAYLSGVSVTSRSDAWAVGGTAGASRTPSRTVILHWDGTAWR